MGLLHLPHLHDYEKFVAENARLRGRNLQPWKAILVAAWLDAVDHKHVLQRGESQDNPEVMVRGLWQRLEKMSWQYQQEETSDLHSGDQTILVLQGICTLIRDMSDMSDISDISSMAWTFSTAQICEAAQTFAKNHEADIDPQSFTSRKVGRLLGKLRLYKSREAGKGTRQWKITTSNLESWGKGYGITLPEILAAKSNVTHVTDDLMSQTEPATWANCEVILRLPADSLLPTIGGCWRTLSDGRMEAGYTSEQLAMALSIFLKKEVDVDKLLDTQPEQLSQRLKQVTGGEVLHIHLKEKGHA